jgi:hypothetical protein
VLSIAFVCYRLFEEAELAASAAAVAAFVNLRSDAAAAWLGPDLI